MVRAIIVSFLWLIVFNKFPSPLILNLCIYIEPMLCGSSNYCVLLMAYCFQQMSFLADFDFMYSF